jgi:hypothetical protein
MQVFYKNGHTAALHHSTIYVPENIVACPQILVLCTNPHLHPPPVPVKTLPPLIDIFHELVSLMMWKLTDATP